MLLMALYIRLLVQGPPNRMELLKESTNISLKLLEPFLFNLTFPSNFGVNPSSLLLTLSIECPLPSLATKLLMKSYMASLLPTLIFVPLALFVLFPPLSITATNLPPGAILVFFLATPMARRPTKCIICLPRRLFPVVMSSSMNIISLITTFLPLLFLLDLYLPPFSCPLTVLSPTLPLLLLPLLL